MYPKRLKRSLAGLLSCFMLFGVNAAAVETVATELSPITVVAGPEDLQSIFESNEIMPLQDDSVAYTYNIDMYDDIHGTATLDFDLNIQSQTYPVQVNGNVEKIELPSYTLLIGRLTGNKIINGIDYVIDVGLTKLDEEDAISAGVAITSADYLTNEDAA